MAYVLPPADSAHFNLLEGLYHPPVTPGYAGFDLATGVPDPGPDPGFKYPIPPAIMVTSALSVALTGTQLGSSASAGYSMTPAQQAVRQALHLAMAPLHFNEQASPQWDRVAVKDEPIGDGIQSWGMASEKWPSAAASVWGTVPIKDDERGGPSQAWDGSIRPIDARTAQGYTVPPYKDASDRQSHADSAKYWESETQQAADGYIASSDFALADAPYLVPAGGLVGFNLQPTSEIVELVFPTRPLFGGREIQTWNTNTPADIRYRHPWDAKPRKGTEVDFDYGQDLPLPGGDPDLPETKRTYIIMNSSSLKTEDGTPLEFSDLSISLDIDSFVWSMSCSILNRASMNLIRPAAAGPAEVVATVNGYQWRFIVERYQLDSRFAKERYQVSGVSRTQLLAAPYAPKRTGRIEAPTNMALAMTNQLQFTGFSVAIQTGLYDYVIPAGAWGWNEMTAMEVISELAAADGAAVVPDRMDDVLHIRHRYKQTPPWQLDQFLEQDMDTIIQDSMIISYASQWEPQPDYNFVFVSGVTHGVAVEVIRTGTAGDKPAQDIVDDLNVEPQQCRLRGMSVLSASGNQEIVTIQTVLPASGSPGLIEPAMLVEVRDTREPENTWRGNVLSNSISVSNPGTGRVVQTVKIERHHY